MFLFYFLFTVQSFLISVWLKLLSAFQPENFVTELSSINIILFSYCFFSMYGVKMFLSEQIDATEINFLQEPI